MSVYFTECDHTRREGGFQLRPWAAATPKPVKPKPIQTAPVQSETVRYGAVYVFLAWIHTIIADLALLWFVRPESPPDIPEDVLQRCQSIKDKHFPQIKPHAGFSEVDDIPRPSWVASVNAAPFGLFHHPGSVEKTGRINAYSLVGPPEE